MSDVWIPVLGSVFAISALGFVGVLMLIHRALRGHVILAFVIAVAAGTLMGDALLHLLPEAVEARGEFPPEVGLLAVGGFLVFFLFEAALRRRHVHGETFHPDREPGSPAMSDSPTTSVKPFGWLNLASDGLHNFVDGGIIAATYLVDLRLGLATTLAVGIHEVPTEFGDFGILLRAGIRPSKALLYNFLSAVTAVGGALFILLMPASGESMQSYGIPLIGGAFLYIAAADLIPELHMHTGRGFMPLIVGGLLLGVGAMFGLTLMET
jgi:zinc and cadmium transporter